MKKILSKIFKHHYTETYLLIILPALFLFLLVLFNLNLFSHSLGVLPREVIYYFFFGAGFLDNAMLFLYLYFGAWIAFHLFKKLHMVLHHEKLPDTPKDYETKDLLRSVLYMLTALFLSMTFLVVAVHKIYHSDINNVISATENIMQVDHNIFGSYVSFAMQSLAHNKIIDFILVNSYLGLSFAISIVFWLILLKDKVMFRKFMLSFLVIPMLSLPIWYAYPVISPSEMYRDNKLNLNFPQEMTSYVKQQTALSSQPTRDLLERTEKFKTNIKTGSFGATAFPSMHIAWGTITLYFGFLILRPLVFILLPWWIFNALGAVYTMQHFAIDTIAGFFVAVFAITLVNILIKREKDLKEGEKDLFLGVDVFQESVKKLIFEINRFYKKRHKHKPFID